MEGGYTNPEPCRKHCQTVLSQAKANLKSAVFALSTLKFLRKPRFEKQHPQLEKIMKYQEVTAIANEFCVEIIRY